jgi:SAM-dependent methyltransferase
MHVCAVFNLGNSCKVLPSTSQARECARDRRTFVSVNSSDYGFINESSKPKTSKTPSVREVLTPAQRTKLDSRDDRDWYSLPRLVHHSDEGFRTKVTQLYRGRIPVEAVVLDLCSSWVSHLPPDVPYAEVIGHGLNAAELAANKRLSKFFVRNLNKEPDDWALLDCSCDAVLIACSIQYLQQPERVFAEIYRVLKPGGVCIVTFTNRMFYEKAIAAWRDASQYARILLVKSYFQAVKGFTPSESITQMPKVHQQDNKNNFMRIFKQIFSSPDMDPFVAVLSYKDFTPGIEKSI